MFIFQTMLSPALSLFTTQIVPAAASGYSCSIIHIKPLIQTPVLPCRFLRFEDLLCLILSKQFVFLDSTFLVILCWLGDR